MYLSLHITFLIVAAYSYLLFSDGNVTTEFKIFGHDTSSYKTTHVWLAHSFALLFFYVGSLLLLKAHLSGFFKTIEIWGRKIEITQSNKKLIFGNLLVSLLGLILALAVILVPDQEMHLSYIDIGLYFLVGIVTNIPSSIYVRCKIASA